MSDERCICETNPVDASYSSFDGILWQCDECGQRHPHTFAYDSTAGASEVNDLFTCTTCGEVKYVRKGGAS